MIYEALDIYVEHLKEDIRTPKYYMTFSGDYALKFGISTIKNLYLLEDICSWSIIQDDIKKKRGYIKSMEKVVDMYPCWHVEMIYDYTMVAVQALGRGNILFDGGTGQVYSDIGDLLNCVTQHPEISVLRLKSLAALWRREDDFEIYFPDRCLVDSLVGVLYPRVNLTSK